MLPDFMRAHCPECGKVLNLADIFRSHKCSHAKRQGKRKPKTKKDRRFNLAVAIRVKRILEGWAWTDNHHKARFIPRKND